MKTRHHPRANRAGVRAAATVAVIAFVAALALPQAAQAQSQSSAVAVLQSEIIHVKAAIIRIDARLDRMDERFDRMDQTIVEIKETAARTDEKINAMQMQNQFIIIPLLLMILAALFGLLTKGTYWGRDRAPNPSAVARAPGASAGVSPGLGAAS